MGYFFLHGVLFSTVEALHNVVSYSARTTPLTYLILMTELESVPAALSYSMERDGD